MKELHEQSFLDHIFVEEVDSFTKSEALTMFLEKPTRENYERWYALYTNQPKEQQ